MNEETENSSDFFKFLMNNSIFKKLKESIVYRTRMINENLKQIENDQKRVNEINGLFESWDQSDNSSRLYSDHEFLSKKAERNALKHRIDQLKIENLPFQKENEDSYEEIKTIIKAERIFFNECLKILKIE